METCNTCGKDVRHPWRSCDPATGGIVHGCVDAAHNGHLVRFADIRWHHRKDAKAIRAETDRHYRALGIKVRRTTVVAET